MAMVPPADPISITSLMSAGGNLLSGLSGFFGGSKGPKQPSFAEQLSAQKVHQQDLDWNRPSWIREGAERAGIHPLIAMGVQPTAGPGFGFGGSDQGGGGGAAALHNMGQGISRASEAVSTSFDRELRRLQLASAAADVEGKELTNARLRSELALMGGTPPAVDLVSDQQVMSRPGDPGKTAGDHPAFKSWDVGRGRFVELPWSDEGVAESMEGLPWPLAWMKMAEMYYKRHDHKTPGYWLARKFRQWKGRR